MLDQWKYFDQENRDYSQSETVIGSHDRNLVKQIVGGRHTPIVITQEDLLISSIGCVNRAAFTRAIYEPQSSDNYTDALISLRVLGVEDLDSRVFQEI